MFLVLEGKTVAFFEGADECGTMSQLSNRQAIPTNETTQDTFDRVCELAALLTNELNSLRISQTLAESLALTESTNLSSRIDFYKQVSKFEKLLIELALASAGGSQAKAARQLGLRSSTLHEMIKRYGIGVEKVVLSSEGCRAVREEQEDQCRRNSLFSRS